MWDILKPLIHRSKQLTKSGQGLDTVSSVLQHEFALLAKARTVYEGKVKRLNSVLATTDTAQQAPKIQELKEYINANNLAKNVSDLTDPVIEMERMLKKAARSKNRPETRRLAQDLQSLVSSASFKEYARQLVIEHAIVNGDQFHKLMPEFKRALDREGHILGWELDMMTQVEDRLNELHGLKDPYRTIDANTITSLTKQVFALYGIKQFEVLSTGSSARGTAVPGSDVDIVVWLPEDVLVALRNNPDFLGFFEATMNRLLVPIESMRDLRMKPRWVYSKYLHVDFFEGSVVLDGVRTNIAYEFTDDKQHFSSLVFYAQDHGDWLDKATKKERKRFVEEVKLFKQYLAAVGLYATYKNIFKGYYIETILKGRRLKRFFADVIEASLPWDDTASPKALASVLIAHGLSREDTQDFLINRYPAIGHTPQSRTLAMLVTAKRYLEAKGPGADLVDVAELLPWLTCVEANLKSKAHIAEFVELSMYVLPIAHVLIVPELGSRRKCIFVLKDRGGGRTVIKYKYILEARHAKTLLTRDADVRTAALAPKSKIPLEMTNSKLLAFYRDVLTAYREA